MNKDAKIDLVKINSYYEQCNLFIAPLVIAFAILLFNMSSTSALSVGAFGLFISIAALFYILDRAPKTKNPVSEADYIAYLTTLPVTSLIMLTKSVEVMNEPKDRIVKFLNEEHAGWSLRISEN